MKTILLFGKRLNKHDISKPTPNIASNNAHRVSSEICVAKENTPNKYDPSSKPAPPMVRTTIEKITLEMALASSRFTSAAALAASL